MMCSVATSPLIVGSIMSMVITSGRSRPTISTACPPSSASPTTCRSGSAASASRRACRIVAESSTTRTRIMGGSLLVDPAIRCPACDRRRVGRRGSCRHQPADVGEQLFLVELTLDDIRAGTDRDAPLPVLGTGPGTHQDGGHPGQLRVGPRLGDEGEPVDTWHVDVGEVEPVLAGPGQLQALLPGGG